VLWQTGVITNGTHTVAIEESATLGGAYTAIPAVRLLAALPVFNNASQNSQAVTGFAVDGAKPFVRAVNVVTAGATGGFVSGVVITTELRLPVTYP
jgi:hypothetical protein